SMRIVIKFAGALLEDDATVWSLARQVATLAEEGHKILIVHGGGRLFTATLKRMAIERKFIAGLRVTDRETRDVAVMVFAGLLNKKLTAACAEYLGADQLIYLTDVAGVLDGERVLSVVTCEDIERLDQCRVVSGGMVLKLEAAKRAIEGGVSEVRIVGGTSPQALLLAS